MAISKVPAEEQKFTFAQQGDVLVATPKFKMMGGPIQTSFIAGFEGLVPKNDTPQFRKVVVEMSGVEWMNASGLGALMGMLTNVRDHEGQLFLSGVSAKVQSLFMITKMVTEFDMYDTVVEATAAFSV